MPAPIPSIPRIRCIFAIILILIGFMLLGITRRAFAGCSPFTLQPDPAGWIHHIAYYYSSSEAQSACSSISGQCSLGRTYGVCIENPEYVAYWRNDWSTMDQYFCVYCTDPDCSDEHAALETECGSNGYTIDESTCQGQCNTDGDDGNCPSERAVLETECGSIGYTIDEITCQGHCNTDGDQCASEKAALEQQCGGVDKYTIDNYTCEGQCICVDADSDGAPDSCDACPNDPALFFTRLNYVVPAGSTCGNLVAGQSCGYVEYTCSAPSSEAVGHPAGDLDESDMLTCCESQSPATCDCDSEGGGKDTDGDGIPDDRDTDDDGDGIPDSEDPCPANPDPECVDPCEGRDDPNCRDTDGDGEPNSTDTDDDGDGIPDSEDTDDDGDGTPDDEETDTDGDGIPDEDDTDDDNDDIPDTEDEDDDGDGTPDDEETDPYQTTEAPYSFISDIGEQFKNRFTQFITEMRATSIFSIPGQIFGSVPTGGSSTFIVNGGETFGQQEFSMDAWVPGLAALRGIFYIVAAWAAVKIALLGV